ncbi:hypothetical protein TRVL_09105 [Trypanosoma vivax]|nr:hypothetical protein TRVL_09105 [Trypanosoma vivax]
MRNNSEQRTEETGTYILHKEMHDKEEKGKNKLLGCIAKKGCEGRLKFYAATVQKDPAFQRRAGNRAISKLQSDSVSSVSTNLFLSLPRGCQKRRNNMNCKREATLGDQMATN